MVSNITSLAEKGGSSKAWSVEQMLESALEYVRSGKYPNGSTIISNKAVLVLLEDDGDTTYHSLSLKCNMSISEEIVALEAAKQLALGDLLS